MTSIARMMALDDAKKAKVRPATAKRLAKAEVMVAEAEAFVAKPPPKPAGKAVAKLMKFPADLWGRIDSEQKRRKLRSRSETIRTLLEEAMAK